MAQAAREYSRWRVGIEWYYTGTQSLDENLYRVTSEPYVLLGLLAEKQLGRIRLFVNGENLTGSGRRDGIRYFSRRALPTADGPSTGGLPSKAGTSTGAFGSDSDECDRIARNEGDRRSVWDSNRRNTYNLLMGKDLTAANFCGWVVGTFPQLAHPCGVTFWTPRPRTPWLQPQRVDEG